MSYIPKLSATFLPHFYGDGSDGDVTISVNTTLTRDMYYNNLTINSGAFLSTDNYRVHVKNTLTLNNGNIRCNNNDASGITAGTLSNNNFYGRGTAGGNGVNGAANGGGSTGSSPGIGAMGGIGGGDGGIRVGGIVGTVTLETAISGGSQFMRSFIGLIFGHSLKTVGLGGFGAGNFTLGTGGTGGGANTASTSGGGGSSGGWVIVCARFIVDGGSGGTIRARGGNGGNAVVGNAGGGGGGSGGICGIVTETNPLPGGISADANGGAGGTPLGAGVAGATGGAGHFVLLYNT